MPAEITAGTGINPVAHCIEALYSTTRNPISTALAKGGLAAMAHALPQRFAKGDDLGARTEMLMGSFMAGTALSNVAMGLHHGICHVLGGAGRGRSGNGYCHPTSGAAEWARVWRLSTLHVISRAMAVSWGGVVASSVLQAPSGTIRDHWVALQSFWDAATSTSIYPKIGVDLTREILQAAGGDVTERIYPTMGHTVNQDEIDFVKSLMLALIS